MNMIWMTGELNLKLPSRCLIGKGLVVLPHSENFLYDIKIRKALSINSVSKD